MNSIGWPLNPVGLVQYVKNVFFKYPIIRLCSIGCFNGKYFQQERVYHSRKDEDLHMFFSLSTTPLTYNLKDLSFFNNAFTFLGTNWWCWWPSVTWLRRRWWQPILILTRKTLRASSPRLSSWTPWRWENDRTFFSYQNHFSRKDLLVKVSSGFLMKTIVDPWISLNSYRWSMLAESLDSLCIELSSFLYL